MITCICGYPRSGNNWLENRLRLFLYKCLNKNVSTSDLHTKYVSWSHRSYESNNFGQTSFDSNVNQDSIVLIIRDAKAVITSLYHYYHKFLIPKIISRGELLPNISTNIGQFIISSYGVKRYCNFLNDLNLICVSSNWLFYEDMFEPKSIFDIPNILGINHIPTKEDISFIHRNSNAELNKRGILDKELEQNYPELAHRLTNGMIENGKLRAGTIDSYKQDLSLKDINYIDDYLKSYCRLEIYKQKYLEIQ